MNRIVRKKVGPPIHKQISNTKPMDFNASSFKGTRRTREGHWEQKVHLTKNLKPWEQHLPVCQRCCSWHNALFLHKLRPVLEKKSPLQELLRHKHQELEKCIPWQ